MHIDNGLLKGDGVLWKKARTFGGDMKAPMAVICHDTAGRMDRFSSVNWFCDPKCDTSAHFVVEMDGTITQMVPTHKRAYHAGVSSWKGVSGLNSCSVGIEIVNPGKLDAKGNAWFGKAAEPTEIIAMSTANHGKGWWLPYTPEQIKAVTAICRALVEEYPDCNEILTHWEIAPKRKIDTNPLFPLEELRRVVFDPTPGELEEVPAPVAPPPPVAAQPTMGKEMLSSVSGKLTAGTILTLVMDWMVGIGRWISDALGHVLTVLGPAQKEAETTVAPLMSLTKTLKVNIGAIGYWMLIAVLVVVLYRHLSDKVKLKQVTQQLPDAPETPKVAA